MRIILFGAPGSGKGTQGDLIAKRYGFPRISTGDLLRLAVRKRTPLGRKAESFMKAGTLVSDEVVEGLVRERIAEPDCRPGYILDGFPRTIAQAEALAGMDGGRPEIVIGIEVRPEVLVGPAVRPARLRVMSGRLQPPCPAAGDGGRLRYLRRRARPAEGRHARGDPGADQGLSRADRDAQGLLPPEKRLSTPSTASDRSPRFFRRSPAFWTPPSAGRKRASADMIVYKTDDEIRMMRESSRIVARILSELRPMIRPGVKTQDLDAHAESRVRELGAKPAFKGYRGYPASLCISVNEEIIHGIPSPRMLREGDIVSLDFGVLYDGFYGDAARTFPVGTVSPQARKLIQAAEQAFEKGIAADGRRKPDLGHLGGRPGIRRSPRFFRDPLVRRARHRPGPPRGAAGPQFRVSRPGAEDPARPGPGDRADDRGRRLGRSRSSPTAGRP